MVDETVRVNIVGDSSSAQSALQALESNVENLQRSVMSTTGSLANYEKGLDNTGRRTRSFEKQQRIATMHTTQLGYQLNDIGVMLAAGQSPFMLAVQQGTQVNQVLEQMRGNGKSIGPALAATFRNFLSPANMATFAIIAAAAALVKFGRELLPAIGSMEKFEKQLSETENSFNAFMSALEKSDSLAFEAVKGATVLTKELADILADIARRDYSKSVVAMGDAFFDAAANSSRFSHDMEEIAAILDSSFGERVAAGMGGSLGKDLRETTLRVKDLRDNLADMTPYEALEKATALRDRFVEIVGPVQSMNTAQYDFYVGLQKTIAEFERWKAAINSVHAADTQAFRIRAMNDEQAAIARQRELRDQQEAAAARQIAAQRQAGFLREQAAIEQRAFGANRRARQQELETLTMKQRFLKDEQVMSQAVEVDQSAAAKAADARNKRMQIAMGERIKQMRELVSYNIGQKFEAAEVRARKLYDFVQKLINRWRAFLNLPSQINVDRQAYGAGQAASRNLISTGYTLPGTNDSGGGGGGAATNPLQLRLDLLRQSLMTEEQLELDSFARRKELLNQALADDLLAKTEHNTLLEKLQREHAERLTQIDAYKYGNGVDMAGQFFGDMATAMANGNEKMLRISKAFGAAQALIGALQGASEALKLPFPQNLVAAAQVLSTGMGFVNAIKGINASAAGGVSGGGGAGVGGGGSALTSQQFNVQLNGDTFSRDQVYDLFDQINTGLDRGLRFNFS